MFKITRLTALIAFIFIFSNTFSQQQNIDSLKQILTKNVHDTIKLVTIANITANFPPTSKEFDFYTEKFKSVAEQLLKRKNLDNNSREYAVSAIGNYYVHKALQVMFSDYIVTIKYLKMSLPYFQAKKHRQYKASTLISLGIMYNKIGSSEIAIANYFEALRIFESLNHASGISYATQSIANLYNGQKKYDEAIIYYLKSYSVYYKKNNLNYQDNIQKVLLFINIAKCYEQLNNCESSQSYLQKALDLATKLKDPDTLSEAYFEMGQNEQNCNNNFDSALKQFQNSYAAAKQPEKHSKSLISIGEMFLKLKQYNKAEANLIEGLTIGKNIKNLKFQKDATDNLVLLYEEKKQFDKAFKMKVLNSDLKDSIKSEINNNELLKKQLQYDYENKENKNKLLQERKLNAIQLETQKKNAVKNDWLIGLSAMLLLLMLGGYFYYRYNKQKQAISVLEKDQIKQKLLVTQMNPHFIFNSIENIQGLIFDDKKEDAADYLTKFSILTRQILENSNENYISLTEEVAMITNYMAIQQLLYNNKFNFTITVEDTLDAETIFLPPMLTQPFIENAIKHGLSNKEQHGMIEIHFYIANEKLFFEVADNGKGFDAVKKAGSHKSLAMTITKERLINYTKNHDFVVHTDNIIDKDANVVGAKVSFEIPYINEN